MGTNRRRGGPRASMRGTGAQSNSIPRLKAAQARSNGCIRREGTSEPARKRLDRRLEEVAEAVGGGNCRLQMPVRLALAVRETVAGHRLGALEGGGGYLPPFQCTPARRPPSTRHCVSSGAT